MKRKTSEDPSKIYSFGCRYKDSKNPRRIRIEKAIEVPAEALQPLHEQLYLAHKYYNKRIELEREKRSKYREIRAKYSPDLDRAEQVVLRLEKRRRELVDLWKETRKETRKRTRSQEIEDRIDALDVELRKARDVVKEERKLFHDEYIVEAKKEFDQRLEALREKTGLRGPNAQPAFRQQILDEMQKENWPDAFNETQQLESDFSDLVKAARKEYRILGLGRTYQLVESALDASFRDSISDPDFKSHKPIQHANRFQWGHHHGRVGVQIPKRKDGMPHTVADIFAGKYHKLQIIEPDPRSYRKGQHYSDRRGRTQLRIETFDHYPSKKPEESDQVTLPVSLHRELPPEAYVRWAWIKIWREATETRYLLQLTLEMPEFPCKHKPAKKGTCAINMGWRDLDTRQRVGFLVDEKNPENNREIPLPIWVMEGQLKVNSLGQIRDKNFNRMRDALVAFKKKKTKKDLPDWFLEKTEYLPKWNKPGRLISLVYAWKENAKDFPAGNAMLKKLEAWRRQDRHLFQWEDFYRKRLQRFRKDHYRKIAADLYMQYETILLGEVDYSELARLEEPANKKEDLPLTARRNRVTAAVSILNDAIKNKCGSRVKILPAGRITLDCHLCGHKHAERPLELEHICENCGEKSGPVDQDERASYNLLKTYRGEREGMSIKRPPRKKKIKNKQKAEAPPQAAE